MASLNCTVLFRTDKWIKWGSLSVIRHTVYSGSCLEIQVWSLGPNSIMDLKSAWEQTICFFSIFQFKNMKIEACVVSGERSSRVSNIFSNLEIVTAQVKLLIKWHLCLYHGYSHNINSKCPLTPFASKKTAFVCSEKKRKKSILQYTDWLPRYFNGTLSPWYPGTQILAINWEQKHQNHISVWWGQYEF